MNINHFSMLEMVEEYMTGHPRFAHYASEDLVSERFDEFLEEIEYFKNHSIDDEVMLNETFSNWMDSESKNGRIHELQCNEYIYCGEHS